jgi:hypothetical protein
LAVAQLLGERWACDRELIDEQLGERADPFGQRLRFGFDRATPKPLDLLVARCRIPPCS